MYEHVKGRWIDLGFYESDRQYFISIYSRPFYRIFVSRGLSIEDRSIGDPITEMIREWGFNTITVRIEKHAPEEQVPTKVREEIQKCDAIVAVATPRYLDALTGLWRTLEWLYSETGIAYGLNNQYISTHLLLMT